MKNKKFILSFFTIFLLISIAWVTPIQVRAYELTKQEIVDKINEIGERLGSDDDFKLLIQLHNNQDVADIFKRVLNADSEDEIDLLVQEYLDIMDANLLKSLFLRLDDKFGRDIESITSSVYGLDRDKKFNLAGNFYKITENDEGLKVIKQKTEEIEEETWLIRGEDLAFKHTNNGDWTTKEELAKLKDFSDALLWNFFGMIIISVGGFISVIGDSLIKLGSVTIGSKVYIFGWVVTFFGFFVCYGDLWLEPILEYLESLHKTKNRKQVIITYIQNLRNNLSNFIRLFLQKYTFLKTII
jgi:hypothetical protein